jgi:putative ABC transport system ATP-binding protein
VVALLDGMVRGHGGTMIVVTHAAHLLRLADRVVELRDGRIAESAPGDVPAPGTHPAGR